MLQVAILIAQSIMLGDLSEYFGITDPTNEDTRDAYLYAVGKYTGLKLTMLWLSLVIVASNSSHKHSFVTHSPTSV